MTKTGKCQLRNHPKNWLPIETEWHHILPKAMGGKDTWDNKIELCALCHDNVHAIMYRMSINASIPKGYRAEKRLAKIALDEWNGVGPVPRGSLPRR